MTLAASEKTFRGSEEEQKLLARCRKGDKAAFGQIVKRYAGAAIGTAQMMLSCHMEAQDASQEAFVKAWKNIKRFDGRSKFYTWFSVILRNCCRDRLRKRKGKQTAELTDGHVDENPHYDPHHRVEADERQKRIREAVMSLPIIHREVIVMSHFQDMSYKEMAAELGIPIGTVTSRLHAARNALRTRLEGEAP
ncbi:MAG: RNA polymerase sigma factor [Planctomycetota bacterium]